MILHGKNEESIARQAIRSGQPLPDFIVNAPELLPGLEFYLNAFTDLSTERPGGMGVNPIPISKIREYGIWFNLDKDEIDDLIYLIKILDGNHIKKVNADLKKKNGKPS